MATIPQSTPHSSLLDQDFRMLIGGELTSGESGEYLTSSDPATGRELAQFPNASPADVERAVKSAKAALPGWRTLDLAPRQALCLEVAKHISESREDYALLIRWTPAICSRVCALMPPVLPGASSISWPSRMKLRAR